MSDYNSFFNGNVQLQCEAGTYPLYRNAFVQHLAKSVAQGVLSSSAADLKLKQADNLWEQHAPKKKTPSKPVPKVEPKRTVARKR